MTSPSHEPRNAIEHAADAALEAFAAALPAGFEVEGEDAHLIVIARVPGLEPDAVIAGVNDVGKLLKLLLVNVRVLGESIGLPITIGVGKR